VVDVIEWMGSELYAYFQVAGGAIGSVPPLGDVAGPEAGPGGHAQLVARLDAASRATEGEELELWLDARRLHLFDPDSGENLTLSGQPAGAVPGAPAGAG
jgi:multiple sugar transport system ATP-binding protein